MVWQTIIIGNPLTRKHPSEYFVRKIPPDRFLPSRVAFSNVHVDVWLHLYSCGWHMFFYWNLKQLHLYFVGIAGSLGNGSDQLYRLVNMVVDWNNSLYIADYYNHRIQKYFLGFSIGDSVAGSRFEWKALHIRYIQLSRPILIQRCY